MKPELPPLRLVRRNPDGSETVITAEQHLPAAYYRLVKPSELAGSKDIGIRRSGGLGDILMTTPALRALNRRWPHLEIFYYTDPRNALALKGNPLISEVRSIADWAEENHEVCVDLNWFVERHPFAVQEPRPQLFAKAFSLSLEEPKIDPRPDLYLTDEELDDADDMCTGCLPDDPWIGVAPTTASPLRDWIHAADALPQLGTRGYVLWFSWNEPPGDVDLWVGPDMNCRQWAAIMTYLDVIICADSGPLHLANAMQRLLDRPVPHIIALLGVASAHNVLYGCRQFTALQPTIECSPCMHQRGRCSGDCRKYHTPERVLPFVDAALGDTTDLEEAISASATS